MKAIALGYLYGLVLVQAVLLSICSAQTQSQTQTQTEQCPTEECNISYRAQLESVNEELRQALEKVNRTLAQQKQLIDNWKTCKSINDTTATAYVAEKVTSLEPCRSTVDSESGIQGVALLDGRLFVICKQSVDMRIYNVSTFQQLPNVTLPISGFPKKYPSYIVANRIEKTLYLGVDGEDATTGQNYAGFDIYRADLKFNWVLLSTATLDDKYAINRLRVARNGQMMYANYSHILFPQSSNTFSRSIFFGKPPLNAVDYIRGIIETKNGSFIIFSMRYPYLLHIASNGDLIGNLSNGDIVPTNGNKRLTGISDMEQGPGDQVLIAESYKDRIVILDPSRNKMTELISRESSGSLTTTLYGPYYLSYDPQNQLLAVGEETGRSDSSGALDLNSLKIFRIKPKP